MKETTTIYFSKRKGIGALLLLIPYSAFGIFLICRYTEWTTRIFGGISFLLPGIFSYMYIRLLASDKPQLILSDKGIQTSGTALVSWPDISNERITTEWGSRGTELHYLEFDYNNRAEKFLIDELTLSVREIETLIHAYRSRYERLASVSN